MVKIIIPVGLLKYRIKAIAQQTVLRNWGRRKETQHQIISKLQLMGGHRFSPAAAFGYAPSAAAIIAVKQKIRFFIGLTGQADGIQIPQLRKAATLGEMPLSFIVLI